MSNEMQQHAVYILFYCKITLHVSGAVHTHHQEYIQYISQEGTLVAYIPFLVETFVFYSMTCTSGCNYSFMYS